MLNHTLGKIPVVTHNVSNEVAMQNMETHNDTPPTAVLQNVLMEPTLK